MLSSSTQYSFPAFFTRPKEPANFFALGHTFIRVSSLLLAGFLVACAARQTLAGTSRLGQLSNLITESKVFPETENMAEGNAAFNDFVAAAGPVRGVGALGYIPPAQTGPPPRPAYGRTPGDYGRGYEGMNSVPGDFWHRESDFRNRNYTTRHTSPAIYATPPQLPSLPRDGRVIEPYDPVLPKPPLPGDSAPPARVRPVAPGAASSKNN